MSTNDFAVIKLNSSQLVVEKGMRFKTDRLSTDAPLNVLLAEIGGKTTVGLPYVDKIGVRLNIIDEGKDKKIVVSRYKSKSRYRRNKGHRQPISYVEVAEIGEGVKTEIVEGEKRKKVKSKPKDKPVSELDLTDSIKEKLTDAGYRNASDLGDVTKEQLMEIKGIGEKAAEKVLEEVK